MVTLTTLWLAPKLESFRPTPEAYTIWVVMSPSGSMMCIGFLYQTKRLKKIR